MPAAGHAVARNGAGKRLVLELGGNAATILCEDADVADAAVAVRPHRVQQLRARAASACSASSSPAAMVDDFTGRLADAVGELRIGDPLDESTDIGSMVDEHAADRVLSWARRRSAAARR